MFTALLALLPLVTPQTAEAVSRAVALEAAQDARFDVVSELDVADTIDFEASKQLCGATSESCASQLAGAYDARFVLFVRLYVVGDETHAALSLRDLKENTVIHRADAKGVDDKSLFADVQATTKATLARYTEPATKPRPRLFVSRAAGAGPADNVAASTPPEPAPSSSSSSSGLPLTGIGAATAGVGAVVGGIGAVVGVLANGTIDAKDSTGSEKADAFGARTAGYATAVVGGVVVVAGAAVAVLGLMGDP